MPLVDPFPRALALGHKELMQLMSISRSDLYEFLQHPPEGFPRPTKRLGKTRNGRPRLRWDKWQVYQWWDRQEEPEES